LFSELAGSRCRLFNTLYGFLLDAFKDYTFDVFSVEFNEVFGGNTITFSQYLIIYWEDPGFTNNFDI